MFSLAGINWIAVMVGVILANVLGFVWYGPLFGKPWMRAIGKSQEELRGSPMMYAVTVIASLITMIVLAASVQAFGSVTLVEGAIVGAALAIGLYATGTYVGARSRAQPHVVADQHALQLRRDRRDGGRLRRLEVKAEPARLGLPIRRPFAGRRCFFAVV